MNQESIEEFICHFDKVALENKILKVEESIERNSDERIDIIQSVFREIHSLKGTSSMLKLDQVSRFLHVYEDALGVISHNIRRIVNVKKTEIFDFYLQGLDLVEKLASEIRGNPDCVIKDKRELLGFYIRMVIQARDIIDNKVDYFEFAELNEESF